MLGPILVVIGLKEISNEVYHVVGVTRAILLANVVLEVQVVAFYAILEEFQYLVHNSLILLSLEELLFCLLMGVIIIAPISIIIEYLSFPLLLLPLLLGFNRDLLNLL